MVSVLGEVGSVLHFLLHSANKHFLVIRGGRAKVKKKKKCDFYMKTCVALFKDSLPDHASVNNHSMVCSLLALK